MLIQLSTLTVTSHQLQSAPELKSDLRDTFRHWDWGRKWLVDFNAGRTQFFFFFFYQSNNSIAVDKKMDESVLEQKLSFKILGLSFSCMLNWGFYIVFIAKTPPKKIGTLILSVDFYLDMSGKLQEWVCRSAGPSYAVFIEFLAQHRNAGSLSLFYRYYFDITM